MRMPFAPFGVPSALTPPTLGRHRMTNRTRILLVVLLAFANARAGNERRVVAVIGDGRSEEHTSELQSLMRISYAVFCLKKKKNIKQKAEHNDSTTIKDNNQQETNTQA